MSGKDVILAVLARDRRRRRDEHGARVRRARRRGAVDRRAAGRREHGRRGRVRDGHLPRGREDGRVPRGPHATRRGWRSAAIRTRASTRRCAIDFDSLEPLIAMPHNPENVKPLSEVARHADPPGLRRELLQRDDDRPAPDGGAAARQQGAREHADDRRPRDAEDLPRRRSPKGCSTSSSRPARPSRRRPAAPASAATPACSARARTRSRRRTATSRGGWAPARRASTSRTRTSRPRRRSPGEIVDPARDLRRECRRDHRRATASSSRGRTSTRTSSIPARSSTSTTRR